MGFYDIIGNRIEVSERILKSFSSDLEKAIPIGSVRVWADGTYKKVDNGKWVKVVDKKNTVNVSTPEILKIANGELKRIENNIEKERKKFAVSLPSQYSPGSKEAEEYLDSIWRKNIWGGRIESQRKNLKEEIEEIRRLLKREKRVQRDKDAGKVELSADEVRGVLHKFNNMFSDIKRSIRRYDTALKIFPVVGLKDYFLDTETEFKKIKIDGSAEEKWSAMKGSAKYEYHKSPKSSSEYLVNKRTGDIYRFSDHWGRVSSCLWNLKGGEQKGWSIGCSNIKDFKRRNNGQYLNPKYINAMLNSGKVALSELKNMAKKNDKFYLSIACEDMIKKYSESLFDNLTNEADISYDEVNKLRKKI